MIGTIVNTATIVIGSIVGVRQYLRTQRQAADIIADIDNLKND